MRQIVCSLVPQEIVKTLHWLAFALLALLYVGPLAANDKAHGLLVMGDSLSAAYGLRSEEGWVSLLSERLKSEHPDWIVVNASVSGETTAGGAARIEAELATHRPKLVVIELGANDGLRGLPLDIARANLEKMILAARKSGAQVLLVGMQIPPNYGADYTQAFVAMYRELADHHKTTLLPFLLAPVAAERENFLEDNLHPAAAAQPVLMAHVLAVLKPML